MFLKILLILACLTLILEASKDKHQCGANQKYKRFVTCEKTCKDLKKKCNLSSRCACKGEFFKDEATGACVDSADKCTLKYAYAVQKAATKVADKALEQAPDPIESKVRAPITVYKAGKFLYGGPPTVI